MIRCQRTSRAHIRDMGLNIDASPLVEEYDPLICHTLCSLLFSARLFLEVPLHMCRKILVLTKLIVNMNHSRPCPAYASLSHQV